MSLEVKLSDDLSYHFSNKNLHQFWKTWNYKCGIYISKNVNITGCTDDVGIANAFVEHFENVRYCFNHRVCDAVCDFM